MHGGNVPSTSYIWFKILFSMFSYSSTSMVFECHSHSLPSDIEIHWLNQFLFYSNKWWKKCSSISFSRHLYLISIICKYWQLENFHKFRIWVKTRNSKPGEEPRLRHQRRTCRRSAWFDTNTPTDTKLYWAADYSCSWSS